MISKPVKDYLPVWCDDCYRQGYIFVDDLARSCFVICKTCGYETSQVWCPECDTYGEFIENISDRPSAWTCPVCKTKHQLSSGFYDQPMNLLTEEELPVVVQEQIQRDRKAEEAFSLQSLLHDVWWVITIALKLVVFAAALLLPLALVLTPLPWSIPGFIVTILSFAVWWWLMGKAFKTIQERRSNRSS